MHGADLLQILPVEVFHNQLLHVLVECDRCLLVVAITDLKRKPHIIHKGSEIVAPLLGRQCVGCSQFLFLLELGADFALPFIRRPLGGFFHFCGSESCGRRPCGVPPNLFTVCVPFQTGREPIGNHLAALLICSDICH